MKYIFYLSGILLFLSACKSNAFLKQRYTNYSHVATKKHDKTTVVNATFKEPVITASSGNTIDETVVSPEVKPEKIILINPVENEGGKNVSDPAVNRPLSESQKLSDKKGLMKYVPQVKNYFQKKSESKRGIIGTLLEIVLSIIVLALLVTVVILVILLI